MSYKIYRFMDEHPFASLILMAIPMFILIMARTTNIDNLIIIIVVGIAYLYATVAISGWLSNVNMGWHECVMMTLKGEWGELAESREISTHMAIATTMSLYAIFVLGFLSLDGGAKELIIAAEILTSFYLYITWKGRVALGRHTPHQATAGLVAGTIFAIPLLFTLLLMAVVRGA